MTSSSSRHDRRAQGRRVHAADERSLPTDRSAGGAAHPRCRRESGSSARSGTTTSTSPRAGSPPRSRLPTSRSRRRCATRVPVNCTVAAVGPEQARAVVARSHGCRTAKVKVAEPGQRLDDDVARVGAVRDALGPSGRVRVDANGGWSVEEAVRAIAVLSEFDLEYVEQPTALVEDLAAVRRRVDVPIAADESIRRASDPLRVQQLGAADIAVLKVQPLGGVRACLRLAEQLDAARRRLVGAGVVGRDRRRRCVGGGAAGAAVRVRTGDDVDVHRRRRRRTAGVRSTACSAYAGWRPTTRPSTACAPSRTTSVAGGTGSPPAQRCWRIVSREPLHRRRADRRRRPAAGRRPGGRARPRLAVCGARPRSARCRRGRAVAAARADRRALGRLPRPGPGQGLASPGRRADDVGDGRRQPAPGRARGAPRRGVAHRARRRPPGRAARHRSQPDDRPARSVRSARGLRRRGPR